MSLDLIKTLIVLASYLWLGPPDDTAHAWTIRLALAPDGAAVELVYDPVLIYYRPPPGSLCGMAIASTVFIHPEPARLGCENTLAHEMGHVWQYREWGLLFPFLYLADPNYWEGPEPWRSPPPHNKRLLHGLLRISIPVWP